LTLTTTLREYITESRWWPWKGSSAEISIVEREDTGNLLALILEARGLYFYLPLLRVEKVPRELQTRGFCEDSECFVEAEYTTEYLREFTKLRHGWFKSTSSVVEVDKLEVNSARPLTLESTNAVAEYTTSIGSLVLKSYRLLSDVNVEVKILDCLARKNYRNIPRVYGFLYYSKWATGVLMERVQGDVDGGYPFYKSLVEQLTTGNLAELSRVGLASKLGVIIGELHIALNEKPEEDFFGVEPVTSSDIETWSSRTERMYTTALRRVDEYVAVLESPSLREELEYWRKLLDNEARGVVEEALGNLELSLELNKARTHQDLHLAQMIYTGDGVRDFVIVDFEGEPGRTSEERLMKEPVLRDVASMIRSFHYLSHAALMNAYSLMQHEASLRMLREDPTLEWRLRHVRAMTYSYIARMLGSGILSPSEKRVAKNLWRYLYPWIVERAVYELYYESLYRPLWISIPTTGLLEARIYKP